MADESGCGPSCCGGAQVETDASEPAGLPFIVGKVDTFVGPVPMVATRLARADRIGALRVRLNAGRDRYRVQPGLYAVGEPDDTAPVLVTANHKLSFDCVRSSMRGRDAWILVLDTRGINVWCAAGKGTFGTRELVRRVREVHLEQVVSHQKLVVPQLGATGVAAREVRAETGFRVVWGPVRAEDLPAFLDGGMKADPPMRRVTFGLRDRAVLIPVELSVLWRPRALALAAVGIVTWWAVAGPPGLDAIRGVAGAVVATLGAGLLAGAVLVPLGLPWVPGRAFSLKGALVGSVAGAAVAAAWQSTLGALGSAGVILAAAVLASFAAMNFTGSSTYTSPSGVEWEMRRAIPLQLVGAVCALVAWVAMLGSKAGGS